MCHGDLVTKWTWFELGFMSQDPGRFLSLKFQRFWTNLPENPGLLHLS